MPSSILYYAFVRIVHCLVHKSPQSVEHNNTLCMYIYYYIIKTFCAYFICWSFRNNGLRV